MLCHEKLKEAILKGNITEEAIINDFEQRTWVWYIWYTSQVPKESESNNRSANRNKEQKHLSVKLKPSHQNRSVAVMMNIFTPQD